MAFDQLKYISKYNRENITYRKISFNAKNQEDIEIAAWIDQQKESTSSYLKRLVVEDMKRRRTE